MRGTYHASHPFANTEYRRVVIFQLEQLAAKAKQNYSYYGNDLPAAPNRINMPLISCKDVVNR